MSTEQHVIVTQEERPGKAPLIHVYGGYTDRPTAQRGARAFLARLFPFERRNWRATTHKVQYDRGLGGVSPTDWALVSAEVIEVEKIPAPELQGEATGIIPGSRTVPPGNRLWDAHGIGVYSEDGHWLTTVAFKTKRQARRFHKALNASLSHNGTVDG